MTRSRSSRALRYAAVLALLGIAAAGAAALFLQNMGVAPRVLGPYLERRSSGHNPLIEGTGSWLAQALTTLDRGAPEPYPALALRIGAQDDGAVFPPGGKTVHAASSAEVLAAIAGAQPGDRITLMPGTYRFERRVAVGRPGTALEPVTLRAARPGTVAIEFDTVEGFTVAAPYWTFENLVIRGACKRQAECEHAFHVIGEAHHFVARNNTISDFNAHFKINGSKGRFPDHGLIEANTLNNSAVRATRKPVTPIDLVAASHWTIRRNQISDFIKGGGDRISYGGFAKGAGSANIFEQNIVLCEQHLRGLPGQRVGLSLGGGATGAMFCRDGRCITEQDGGVIRSNLIASCSDDGIYLNSAARSRVVHNTLLDTGGVSVRFPESSADLEGNLVDGAIRSRNGGVVRLVDNRQTPIALLYLGWHPVRSLFAAPGRLDFGWAGAGPRRQAAAAPENDLCGAPRPPAARFGAFEDFAACQAPRSR